MNPIFKKQSSYEVDSFDLCDFVAKCYGIPGFELLEAPNYSVHDFDVTKEELNSLDKNDLEKALEMEHIEIWNFQIVMDDLCRKGFIKPGIYYVSVSR